MGRFVRYVGLVALLAGCPVALARESCYLYTPYGYQRMGGSYRIGPYPSRSSCSSVNSGYFNGNGRCDCETISEPTPVLPSYPSSATAPARVPTPPRSQVDWRETEREEEERQARLKESLQRMRRNEQQQRADEAARFRHDKESVVASLKQPSSAGRVAFKEIAPEHDLGTALKRLQCSAGLALLAIREAERENSDASEVKFLGDQSFHALAGEKLDVQCPSTVPPVGDAVAVDLQVVAPVVQTVIQRTGRALSEIQQARRDAAEAQKLRDAAADTSSDSEILFADLEPLSPAAEPPRMAAVRKRYERAPPPNSLWEQFDPRLRLFLEREDVRDRLTKGFTTLEELRSRQALQELREASAERAAARRRGASPDDNEVERRLGQLRDLLLRREDRLISAARAHAIEQMLEYLSRVEPEHQLRTELWQKFNDEVDRAVKQLGMEEDAGEQRIVAQAQRELATAAARLQASQNLTAAQRVLALRRDHDRVLAQTEKDAALLRRHSIAQLGAKIDELKSRGIYTPSEYFGKYELDLTAASRSIAAAEEKAVQDARAESLRLMIAGIPRVKNDVRQQQLAQEEARQRAADAEARKQRADKMLHSLEQITLQLMADPTRAVPLLSKLQAGERP